MVMVGIDGEVFAYAVYGMGNNDKTAVAMAAREIQMFKPVVDRGVVILLDMS